MSHMNYNSVKLSGKPLVAFEPLLHNMARKCSQTLNFDSESSDDESNNGETENQPAKRRKLLDWNFVKQFSTKQAAEEFIKSENKWVYKSKYQTADAEILKFVCRSSDSCSSKCCIILLLNNTSVIVEKTTDQHDHVDRPKTGNFANFITNCSVG